MMFRFATLSMALCLFGCSASEEQLPEQPASDIAPGIPASETLSNVDDPPGSIVSRYSSLDECTIIRSNPNEDWSVSRCPGRGGYGLVLNYGDARDALQITKMGGPTADIDLASHSGGGFNALGETIEWRGKIEFERFFPSALIVRNTVSENPEDSTQQTALLAVIDLKQSCLVALVRPTANQNAAARAIADGPQRSCLKP